MSAAPTLLQVVAKFTLNPSWQIIRQNAAAPAERPSCWLLVGASQLGRDAAVDLDAQLVVVAATASDLRTNPVWSHHSDLLPLSTAQPAKALVAGCAAVSGSVGCAAEGVFAVQGEDPGACSACRDAALRGRVVGCPQRRTACTNSAHVNPTPAGGGRHRRISLPDLNSTVDGSTRPPRVSGDTPERQSVCSCPASTPHGAQLTPWAGTERRALMPLIACCSTSLRAEAPVAAAAAHEAT